MLTCSSSSSALTADVDDWSYVSVGPTFKCNLSTHIWHTSRLNCMVLCPSTFPVIQLVFEIFFIFFSTCEVTKVCCLWDLWQFSFVFWHFHVILSYHGTCNILLWSLCSLAWFWNTTTCNGNWIGQGPGRIKIEKFWLELQNLCTTEILAHAMRLHCSSHVDETGELK